MGKKQIGARHNVCLYLACTVILSAIFSGFWVSPVSAKKIHPVLLCLKNGLADADSETGIRNVRSCLDTLSGKSADTDDLFDIVEKIVNIVTGKNKQIDTLQHQLQLKDSQLLEKRRIITILLNQIEKFKEIDLNTEKQKRQRRIN